MTKSVLITVYTAGSSFAGVKGIPGQRIQHVTVLLKQFSHRCILTTHMVGKIAAAFCFQGGIQLFHGVRSGNGDAYIPADITDETFYKPFFVAGGGIAKDCLKAIVGRECGISGLLSCMGTETVFDSNLAIVKYDPFGNAAEVPEYTNQCIQKALFVLPAVSEYNGCIAVAHTGTEQIYGCPDSLQIDGSFAPVYLHGISCRESKRNKGFLCFLPELMHQPSDRCLTACEPVFLNQSVIDPLCSMVLLFGTAVGILFQALPDEGDGIVCNDGSLSAVVLALPGDAVAIPILFDGVAGNVQHTGNLPLAHPVKPHSAYVFVNFQCDYHLCTPPYNNLGLL